MGNSVMYQMANSTIDQEVERYLHTRYREWPLQIDFAKREEFAYACEAYHRIVERGVSRAYRRRLLAESTFPVSMTLDDDEDG